MAELSTVVIYENDGDGTPIRQHKIDAAEALATGKYTTTPPGNAKKEAHPPVGTDEDLANAQANGKALEEQANAGNPADETPDEGDDPGEGGGDDPRTILLENNSKNELMAMAEAAGLTGYTGFNKEQLVDALIEAGVE